MKSTLLQIPVPPRLKVALKKLAEKEHRSLTSQALAILEAEVAERMQEDLDA
jgi:hypothetical protein